MRYEVRYEDNFEGGAIAEVYIDGKPIEGDIESLLNSQAAELSALQDANMDLLAALEASSMKLGEARGFIQGLADNVMPEREENQAMMYRATVRDAHWQVAQWETVATAPEESAKPKFKVGDKVLSSAGGLGVVKEYLANGYVDCTGFLALELDLELREESENAE